MHENDSVIINNVRIFLRFATLVVGYDAVHMFLSILTLWCRFDLHSVFLSWASRSQQGRPAIQKYEGRAASSGPFCMDWSCTVPRAAMHRMVSMQCCDPTNRLRGSKIVAQALSMMTEPDWQLQAVVNALFGPQLKTFYSEGKKKTGRWGTKCIKRKGTLLKYDVLVRSVHLL